MSRATYHQIEDGVWRWNPALWGCFLFGISYHINPIWLMGWIVAAAPIHELGHAATAWLASRFAIPTWIFHTAVWHDFSLAVFIVVTLLLGALLLHTVRSGARVFAWICGGLLTLHLIISTLSEHFVNGLISAGGLAGESLLGALFMSLPWIYARAAKSTRLIALACLGAISLGHALSQWISIVIGVEPLPMGSFLFGSDHGDLNDLSSIYGWSPNLIVSCYLSLSLLSTLYVTLCWWVCPAEHQAIDNSSTRVSSAYRINNSLLLGWVYDRWSQMVVSLCSLSSRSALSGENFFGMIYLIFMTDGKLDANEADFLDQMNQRFLWMYPRSIKIKKMQSMRAARASGKPFTTLARNFVQESNGDKNTLFSALECLVIAAGCNGSIEPKQTVMLGVACSEFGFTPLQLNEIIREQFEFIDGKDQEDGDEAGEEHYRSYHRQQDSESHFTQHSPLSWAYRELGCSTDANSAQIKKRYRIAIKRLHPDSLSGRDVSPKVARDLAEKFIKVQRAYEALEHAGVV